MDVTHKKRIVKLAAGTILAQAGTRFGRRYHEARLNMAGTVARRAVGIVLITAFGGSAAALDLRPLSRSAVIPEAIIVGRAVCGGTTWLLTEQPQLLRVVIATRVVTRYSIQGFLPDDKTWGLACLEDRSLWTLATPHALARLSPEGRVLERQTFRFPRLALFGAGQRLLIQQLPTVAASPVLATVSPRRPDDVRPWPGLLGRAGTPREQQLESNLVNCGIATGAAVPCWFVNEGKISVSDGGPARVRPIPALRSSALDQSAPIWDVALLANGRLWVLATITDPKTGKRSGGRLILVNDRSIEGARIDLSPPARLILSATESGVLLVGARGELMEVTR